MDNFETEFLLHREEIKRKEKEEKHNMSFHYQRYTDNDYKYACSGVITTGNIIVEPSGFIWKGGF